jgi:dolichyl-phosphate beta-glucosyltransferase
MFNEEERVAESVDPLIDFVEGWSPTSRLLFVDDGSTDGSRHAVTSALTSRSFSRGEVVERPHLGKGATVRAGLLRSRADVAAFCDVDLATPLPELARIIDVAAAESCLAIGSRATEDAHLEQRESRRREILGRAYNRVVRTLLCPGVADTQCGAKAAPSDAWRAVLAHSRQDRFAWDVEVIAVAMRLGIPVRELGIEWNHDDRTRVRVVRDGADMVASVPAIAMSVRRAKVASRRQAGLAPQPLESDGVVDLSAAPGAAPTLG